MSRRHYVLRSQPTELSFFDTMQAAIDVIQEKHGLDFKYSHSENMGENLGRHIYVEMGNRALLRVVNDHRTPVRYLIVDASTDQGVEELSSWLGESLPFILLQELQQDARAKGTTDPGALIRLAIGAGEMADPETQKILSDSMQATEAIVRFRAAEAAGLVQWPEFIPALTKLKESDSSPEVREMAGKALEACQRRIGKEPNSEEKS
jgi:hypothetical protein